MVCSQCGQEKELTRHGTCFKCHIGGIQTSRPGCKNCRSTELVIAEHRVSQDISTKITVTPVEE